MGFGYSQETINRMIEFGVLKEPEFPVKIMITNPSNKEPYYQLLFCLDEVTGTDNPEIESLILRVLYRRLEEMVIHCLDSAFIDVIRFEFRYGKSRIFQEWLLNTVLEFESIKDADGNQIFKCV